MHYEIYIDKLLLLNFLMNLFSLEVVNRIFLCTATHKKILVGAAFGAVSYLLPFLLPGSGWLKLIILFPLGMTVMLQTVFRFDHVFAFLRIVALMLCVSFVFGGAILFLEQMIPAEGPYQLMSVWGILLVGMLVFWGMEKMLSGCEKEVVCLVELSGKGAVVSVKALVDSGNSLVEPVSGLPVCVVEREVFRRLWQKGNPEGIRLIPYRSVGRKKGILYGYPVPEMVIHIRGVSIVCRNVYVGIAEEKLSSDGTYGMLLHPALLKEDFRVR